ncbi:tRNA uracil 4-sulfurtransferase ThiI [Microaceticoccus formicicus]|uniref:tRNA uracil 4-sulfurtransferase ThiI n=1 Tax=Microaceticoccus formicicus TaxID=3118105 RepID=UPI003CD00B16|nr:tRNA uracil 4-sulfurtransferase ThiI [Peptoniphilaceae bacterium AMB_02]
MDKVISVSFGELVLKGANRRVFVNRAIKKIKKAISHFNYKSLYMEQGKVYIEADESLFEEMIAAIQKVFGLIYISPCIRTEKAIDSIYEALSEEINQYKGMEKTFKVHTNRVDKSFKPISPELNKMFGAHILKNYDNLSVDVHNPEIEVFVDIKEHAYIYTRRYKGLGGLPMGSSGRGLVLFSGGIDSPVAAFQMAKRGVEISALHFHSYPYTGERSLEKVKKLVSIVSDYIGPITMYSVNILPIQTAINENCPAREMTVLSRRFMMRIADRIAKTEGHQMIITGESLGQVASQTIEGLTAVNVITDIPILRPLIGNDKTEIIEISNFIGTYETSILPYEDSCTVFLPKKPVIKPRIIDLEISEEKLDIEALVDDAIEKMEKFRIVNED